MLIQFRLNEHRCFIIEYFWFLLTVFPNHIPCKSKFLTRTINSKLRSFDISHEDGYISSIAFYLHTVTNLTTNELIIIFTKASNSLNKIDMTIADEIRLEEREANAFEWIKGLIQNGISPEIIAKSFGLSIQKIEEVISKIKASHN